MKKDREVRNGDYAVVEADGRVYLGTVKIDRRSETVTVYSGVAGHPPIIPLVDVDAMTHPEDHPDVVMR